MAEGGPSSMDIDRSILQNTSLTSSTPGDFNRRPHFLRHEKLKEIYGCALCKDVLLQPHQTTCGQRVCKKCIEDRFGDELNITCPLPHDDMEDEEEPCQREGGLRRTEIMPDSAIHRQLLGEKCFCSNKEFGCCEYPKWKELHKHQLSCAYKSVRCDADLCEKMFPESQRTMHEERECNFVPVRCQYCNREMLRGELEEHKLRCQRDCNAYRDAHAFKRAGGKMNTQSLSSTCERPDFVRRMRLLDKYDCAICRDICLDPHQTPCGTLVCKECFNDKVRVKGTIPCPCKGNANECKGDSLRCGDITPDRRVRNKLLQEGCFCRNKQYGCTVQPSWSKLKIHEENCVYAPVRCRNSCCNKKIPRCNLEEHMSICADKLHYITEQEDPFQDQLKFHCSHCNNNFSSKIKHDIHQRIEPGCITSPGKCYFFEFCHFETPDVEKLKDHHRLHVPAHSAYLAANQMEPKIVSITRHGPPCISNPVSGEDEVGEDNRAQQAWDSPQPGRNPEE